MNIPALIALSGFVLAAGVVMGAEGPVGSANLAEMASGAAPIAAVHLHNVFRASSNVFSGDLPVGAPAFAEIAKLGVRTIVSVDGMKPDVEAARRYGMRYVHLPFGYDGIPPGRVCELLKAAEAGPLYVHCHHGTHRGPAAVAVICEGTAGWTTNQAVSWLHQAGTSADYAGLYRSVMQFRFPGAAALARVGDLPQVAKIPSLVEAMVLIDAASDRLKAAQGVGWARVPLHPDTTPAETATLLWEQFREMLWAEETAKRPADFREKLAAMESAAERFQSLLRETKVDRATRDEAFRALGRNCVDCHKVYRD